MEFIFLMFKNKQTRFALDYAHNVERLKARKYHMFTANFNSDIAYDMNIVHVHVHTPSHRM